MCCNQLTVVKVVVEVVVFVVEGSAFGGIIDRNL